MAETYDLIARLNELLKDMDFAMLTTLRPDGSLHSCPMVAQKVNSDATIWFLTSNRTEKVEAIKTASARLNLGFCNPGKDLYVSVSGTAELVRNHGIAKELWNPRYEKWLPKGLNDPDLILLCVHVEEAEYWSASEARMIKMTGFSEIVSG